MRIALPDAPNKALSLVVSSMSDLVATLDDYRAHYVEYYTSAIVEYREKYQPGGPEILVEIGGREALPYAFRLYRMDLASGAVEPPNFTEVNVHRLPPGTVQEFAVDELSILLAPVLWNGVEITCGEFDRDSDLIAHWAIRWIDPDESHQSDENGLGGYVHSVTWPEYVGAEMSFSVDFGSAGPEAFVELMSVLGDLGVRQVDVSSSWVENGT